LTKAIWADFGRVDAALDEHALPIALLASSAEALRFSTTIGVELEVWGRFNLGSVRGLLNSPLSPVGWAGVKVSAFGVTLGAFFDDKLLLLPATTRNCLATPTMTGISTGSAATMGSPEGAAMT
jgi:hypothetical protein